MAQSDREHIRGGDDFIRARVKGQDHAVTHVLDIVKRAVTGVGSARRGGRPRGVVFLAGPTGVGKTELAKTLTQLLFGDERAYIRFDMSEFSAEHSDQRLIGAPPGYVGYDAGGELTNAMRERPFSVVLFDEIEKAHPRILDKFLQMLDDGVLTSGRGERVYFSEAFICFTSNLGIYRLDATGERVPNVTPSDAFDTVRGRVLEEIERHFKLVLNRPEILNRIGDNMIVFDFIRPDVAGEILELMIGGVLEGVREQGISITLAPRAHEALAQVCLEDLSNGGRGIRNKVELHLVNPLARALFDADATLRRCVRDDRPRARRGHPSGTGTGAALCVTALALSRALFPVTTLGPGRRLGIWFQGCSIRCRGCISVDTWPPGEPATATDVGPARRRSGPGSPRPTGSPSPAASPSTRRRHWRPYCAGLRGGSMGTSWSIPATPSSGSREARHRSRRPDRRADFRPLREQPPGTPCRCEVATTNGCTCSHRGVGCALRQRPPGHKSRSLDLMMDARRALLARRHPAAG